ncbi:MAG TPA: TetR/AcrR family transcriptional regulator [Anaeromyxobacter sp.]|jgi:AcrR family transcriptional regulator|nr:TetR/AcrR family transcriptional regulator [Anaeromyxobacter sp.]
MSPRAAPRFFIAESDPPSKQAILDAALTLFVKHGLAGTNVRMIAEAAGYTNPAMFKFFESKDALAVYLFERCYLWLHGQVAAAAARPEFGEALSGVVDAFLAAMDEDLEAVLFVQDTLREQWPRLPASTRRRSILRDLRALAERGLREGAVSGYASPDIPVAALVGVVAQLGRMIYFGEVARPACAHGAELVVALTRLMKG